MEKLNKGILISHPGHLLVAYQAALALQEAGMLDGFETGFYYRHGLFSRGLLSLFPKRIAALMLRQFRRRTHAGLRSDRVRTHPLSEVIYVLLSRMHLLRGMTGRMVQLRNEYFDAKIGRAILKNRPHAVICYDSCALHTFEAAKKVGTTCILDQVVGHIKAGSRILAEERLLHPEFSDSIPELDSDWALERCSKEVLSADMVIAPSEYVRDTLVMNGVLPTNIAICPYGVDTSLFFPAIKAGDRPFRILFVGQLSQRKGIKYLLEAVKGLGLENAELVLMGGIAGDGEGLKSYAGIFRHISHVPYAELPGYYQSADIFVYPSLHEGSALAIYEALASGLPVITTPNSGSVVRNGIDGFIVPIRDVGALQEKILLLYSQQELRSSMSRQARLRAQSFTWQAYRLRLTALLRDHIQESES